MTDRQERLGRFARPGGVWFTYGPDDADDPEAIPPRRPRPATRLFAALAILALLGVATRTPPLEMAPPPDDLEARIEYIYHHGFCGGDMSAKPSPEIRAHILEMIALEDAAKAAKSGRSGHDGYHDHDGRSGHDGATLSAAPSPAGQTPPCCQVKTDPLAPPRRRREEDESRSTPENQPEGDDDMCQHGLSYELKAIELYETFKTTPPGKALGHLSELLQLFVNHGAEARLEIAAAEKAKLADLIVKPGTASIGFTLDVHGRRWDFTLEHDAATGACAFVSKDPAMKPRYDMHIDSERAAFTKDAIAFAALATATVKAMTGKPEPGEAAREALAAKPPKP
jgi:hypothetical protein